MYKRTCRSPSGREYVRYVAQVRIGDGRYLRRVMPTRKAADDERKRMLASTEVSRLPLGDYLRSWLDETAAPSVSANTLRGYRASAAALATIEDIPLEGLTTEDVERALNRMVARRFNQTDETVGPASPKTRRNALAMLRAALGAAVARGHLERNVATHVKPPRVARDKPETMTPERARAILAATAKDQFAAAYALAMCGMRASEVLGLSWADVDLRAGTIRIHRQLSGSGRGARLMPLKTRSSAGTLPLPAFALARLKAHERRQRRERPVTAIDGGALVFVTGAGWAVNGSWLTKHFKGLLVAAGMDPMRLHDLRHGAASLLASLGVHPSVSQAILRHSTARMTLDGYTSVTADLQREAMDRLGRAVR